MSYGNRCFICFFFSFKKRIELTFVYSVGVRGISYLGDIAIDDITFTPDCITNGSRPVFPTKPPICGTSQFTCITYQKCIPISQKCDGIKQCVDGSDEDKTLCAGGKTGKSTGNRSGTSKSSSPNSKLIFNFIL